MRKTAGDRNLQNLVIAVVLAEVQQRPRWFRRLERLGGKVLGAGTYGVAQVAADNPITDEESIDILVDRLNTDAVRDALLKGPYSLEFEKICQDLNSDFRHASRIKHFYETIDQLRDDNKAFFDQS